jgi:predicted outer membrane repeat protein
MARSRAAGALAALAVDVGSAATIRVPGDFPDIQAGIDAAAEGDTVLVAAGVYSGEGNYNINFSRTTLPEPHNVVLMSESGAGFTTIDVGGHEGAARRGFLFQNGEGRGSVVDGFTIVHGWMSGPPGGGATALDPHELSGGGMVIRNPGTAPTIRNCVFRENHSFYSGGALEAEILAAPVIEDCVFAGNTTGDRGGAISFESQSRAEMRNCQITGNRAGLAGGALALSSNVVIENCLLAGNWAAIGGGVDVRFPAAPTFVRCIVWKNCASQVGDNWFVDGAASVDFECSVVDSIGGQSDGPVGYVDCGFGDPLLCDPRPCGHAPTGAGTFTLAENSPCVAEASPCGALIGPFGVGCGPLTPVGRISWGSLKARFGVREAMTTD